MEMYYYNYWKSECTGITVVVTLDNGLVLLLNYQARSNVTFDQGSYVI